MAVMPGHGRGAIAVFRIKAGYLRRGGIGFLAGRVFAERRLGLFALHEIDAALLLGDERGELSNAWPVVSGRGAIG